MTRFTFSSARGLADSVLEWFQGVQQSGFDKTTRAQLALTRLLSRELIRNSVCTYRLCWQRLSESVETKKNWVTLNAIQDKNNNNQWEIDNNATRAFNEMEY